MLSDEDGFGLSSIVLIAASYVEQRGRCLLRASASPSRVLILPATALGDGLHARPRHRVDSFER